MSRRKTTLSPRQTEIMRLVSVGKTDKEIAGDLGISPRTVNHHIRIVFTRLRVKCRIMAVLRLKRL